MNRQDPKDDQNRREVLTFLARGTAALALTLVWGPGRLWAHNTPRHLAEPLKDPKYASLLEELSVKHGFSSDELRDLFMKAHLHSDIPRLFASPPETLPYSEYRQRHVTAKSISRGRRFMDRHRAIFDRVEPTYEVDAPVIGGILGVETKFGNQTTGRFKVFDALNTIFSEIPRKETFARRELIEFLLLCREEGLKPGDVHGSFAGAMGMPQFIPSSYRFYAVDFDGDNRRDLWGSPMDIIGSVAHYLKHHGWKKGAPVKVPLVISLKDPTVRNLADRGLKGKITLGKLKTMGVSLESLAPSVNLDETVSLIYLRGESKNRPVVIFSNFRTILKYNNAINYAMAVSDLASALES